jgi:hypothetical protein
MCPRDEIGMPLSQFRRLIEAMADRYGEPFKPYAWDMVCELARVDKGKPSPIGLVWTATDLSAAPTVEGE